MTIAELLKKRGTYVHTTDESGTVAESIAEMALKKTDVLIVASHGRPVGIFTESDVFRCCRLYKTESFSGIKVSQVMSRDIVSASSGDDVKDVLDRMLQKEIRHLPVFDSGQIAGMLNINDLVREQLEILRGEIHFLNDYISRLQDAGHD